MQFTIRNRWTGAVQYGCEMSAEVAGMSYGFRLGFAIKKAADSGADLTDADLTGADLTGADLTDADLTRAVLTGADLTGADLTGADLTDADLTRADLTRAVLTGAVLTDADLTRAVLTGAVLTDAVLTDADLRAFKADLWMTLTQNPHEVLAVIDALRNGRVNGLVYEGPCACLVGTIANARGIWHEELEHNARNPAECWFMMIRQGDKPGDATGGGFAAKLALEWCIEWCALNGVDVPAPATTEA